MAALLIATKNAHKTEEIRALLGLGWQVCDLNDYPEIESPEETGETFAENAQIKALTASGWFPGLVLADDSGLEVDALDGAPGVRSARYAGEGVTDADNRVKLLEAMAGKTERTARFRCVLVLARRRQVQGVFTGAVEGRLLEAERGEGGFGYDSLFVPQGYEESFGELSAEVKNRESHRAKGMVRVKRFLLAAGDKTERTHGVYRTYTGPAENSRADSNSTPSG